MGYKHNWSVLFQYCLLFHSCYHFTYPKCPTTIHPTQPHSPSFYVSSSGYCVVGIHILITILPIPKCTTILPFDATNHTPPTLLFSLVHFQPYREGSCVSLCASSKSSGWTVTRLVWMAQRLVSSRVFVMIASEAVWSHLTVVMAIQRGSVVIIVACIFLSCSTVSVVTSLSKR